MKLFSILLVLLILSCQKEQYILPHDAGIKITGETFHIKIFNVEQQKLITEFDKNKEYFYGYYEDTNHLNLNKKQFIIFNNKPYGDITLWLFDNKSQLYYKYQTNESKIEINIYEKNQ